MNRSAVSGLEGGASSSERLPEDVHQFAMEDYKGWLESLNRSEEIGEKRLEFFVTFATGVVGALLALAKVGNDTLDREEAVQLARWVLPMLLGLGVLTFLRMLRRDSQTDLCKAQLNRARAWFMEPEATRRISDHWPPWQVLEDFSRKERLVFHGGLSTITLAVNGMLLGLCLGVWHSVDSVDAQWFLLGNLYGWTLGLLLKFFSENQRRLWNVIRSRTKSNRP